jgi:site-specific recombinase XerD
MLLSDALTAMFLAKDLTPKSVTWYEENLQAFFASLPTDTTDSLTPEQVRAFVYGRKASGKYSDATVHGYMRAIKSFLNFLVREGHLSWDVKRLEMPRVKQKVMDIYTDAELGLLFAAAKTSPRDTAILWVLLDTGIRADELCTLTRERTHIFKDEAYLVVRGKGRKEREVGLGRKSAAALHRYLMTREDKEPATFLSARHAALTVVGLQKLLYRLGSKQGFDCHPHKFRHTYAVKYMEQPGASIYKLSKLLGHSMVTTTENYLRAFQQRLARVGASVGDSWRNS